LGSTPAARIAEIRDDYARTLMEAPSGQGFGRAAEGIAKLFLAPATAVNGKPISDFAVQIPIVFDPAVLDASEPPVGKPKRAALPSVTVYDDGAAIPEVWITAFDALDGTQVWTKSFGGGGIYHPDAATLTRIRLRIVSHAKAWARVWRASCA
jgi:hypothetical protein